jgi:hypothetical protein
MEAQVSDIKNLSTGDLSDLSIRACEGQKERLFGCPKIWVSIWSWFFFFMATGNGGYLMMRFAKTAKGKKIFF